MLLHRLLHALNALLLVGMFAFAATTYASLPERFPTHFDASGQPDGWSDKSPLSVLMLPLVGLGCAALMYGCVYFIRRRPDLVNVPGKVPFRDWPEENQREAQQTFASFLYGMATGLLVLFFAMQWGTVEATRTGALPGVVLALTLACIVLSLLSTPLLFYRLSVLTPRPPR